VPVPMVDDVQLKATQCIRQETVQGFVRQQVAGLDGTVHQKLGRHSHRVVLSGLLLPETAADDLKTLQEKTSSGAEVTFTADITTALEVQHMVIESLAVEQEIGAGGQYAYTLELAESPPLPPPAELSPFGGLGDFGVGDLGFDAGALGDLAGEVADQAGAIAGTLDGALDAVKGLGSLASLGDLANLSNPLTPLTDAASGFGKIGSAVGDALGELGGLLK
jgi:phage protein U